MYREYAHEITLDCPLSEAMPLFTPKGEEAWVPDWKPDYITPETGETCKEMLFITSHGDEMTYWTCMDWQPEQGHVRYLRLTPASRVGFVDVLCQEDGSNKTRVRVTYQLHALSSSGHTYLNEMTQDVFMGMIDEWQQLIAGNVQARA
ncbi:MAG: hypothetical protein OER56_15930 [Hyphomicrobiales bacterium]|nr:hypothetical protein [Hyphomicrobiales bacterium]